MEATRNLYSPLSTHLVLNWYIRNTLIPTFTLKLITHRCSLLTTLCQLGQVKSYLVLPEGLEPPTPVFPGQCSNQLSYSNHCDKCVEI